MCLSQPIRIFAPAKINLFLEVLGKRADGFHDIRTVISAIDIYDILELRSLETDGLLLSCRWSPGLEARTERQITTNGCEHSNFVGGALPPSQDNLVYRVLQRLREASGVQRGAQVRLLKQIPAEAGLGGASSDAAAALIAANAAWGLNWSGEQLAELGAELGSDIPFFFSQGAALCEGRGERVRPVAARRLHCVLAKPPVGLSTAAVYQHCQAAAEPRDSGPLLDALARGTQNQLAATLFNRLQAPAEALSAEVAAVRGAFAQTGCLATQMTGSGACCFAVYRSARQARVAAAQLRLRNIGWVRTANTFGGHANQHHEGVARWKSPRFASS